MAFFFKTENVSLFIVHSCVINVSKFLPCSLTYPWLFSDCTWQSITAEQALRGRAQRWRRTKSKAWGWGKAQCAECLLNVVSRVRNGICIWWPFSITPHPLSLPTFSWSRTQVIRSGEGKKQETLRRRGDFPSGHTCICIRTPSLAIKTNTISWIYFMGENEAQSLSTDLLSRKWQLLCIPFSSLCAPVFDPQLSHLPCLFYPSYHK